MHQLLIVDDQPDLADDLAEMLPWDSIGIQTVHKAYSAQAALDIIAANPVAIVISDIRMPGMSGLDLIERIRHSWKKIRCILLSGHDDFEYAQRALQNKATDFLLKPAEDEALLQAVAKAMHDIEDEWMEVSSYQNALYSMKKNLPTLRHHLLTDLLEGRHTRRSELPETLRLLELPFESGKPFGIILLRMEDYFDQLISADVSLMEFAVSNMAEEIFMDSYHLWQTKDKHDYLVFLFQSKRPIDDNAADVERNRLESKAAHLQHKVKHYLKGTVSALISQSGDFPQDINRVYNESLMQFRRHIGNDRELILSLSEEVDDGRGASSLIHLYDPPMLVHLLESGQWTALDDKVQAIFDELEQRWGHSHEHILETYFMIASSLSFSVHKTKRWMSDIFGEDFVRLADGPHFHTIQQLRDWTERIVAKYKKVMAEESKDSRSTMVRQVQDYVQEHLGDASLQSIAAHVSLNPSYLSKIYKLETGEGISDYLLRLKMEQAMYKLRATNEKIYEIAAGLGYLKTSYFIKLFREKYGMTPQEYRERL